MEIPRLNVESIVYPDSDTTIRTARDVTSRLRREIAIARGSGEGKNHFCGDTAFFLLRRAMHIRSWLFRDRSRATVKRTVGPAAHRRRAADLRHRLQHASERNGERGTEQDGMRSPRMGHPLSWSLARCDTTYEHARVTNYLLLRRAWLSRRSDEKSRIAAVCGERSPSSRNDSRGERGRATPDVSSPRHRTAWHVRWRGADGRPSGRGLRQCVLTACRAATCGPSTPLSGSPPPSWRSSSCAIAPHARARTSCRVVSPSRAGDVERRGVWDHDAPSHARWRGKRREKERGETREWENESRRAVHAVGDFAHATQQRRLITRNPPRAWEMCPDRRRSECEIISAFSFLTRASRS